MEGVQAKAPVTSHQHTGLQFLRANNFTEMTDSLRQSMDWFSNRTITVRFLKNISLSLFMPLCCVGYWDWQSACVLSWFPCWHFWTALTSSHFRIGCDGDCFQLTSPSLCILPESGQAECLNYVDLCVHNYDYEKIKESPNESTAAQMASSARTWHVKMSKCRKLSNANWRRELAQLRNFQAKRFITKPYLPYPDTHSLTR